jgi:hypothetical protein
VCYHHGGAPGSGEHPDGRGDEGRPLDHGLYSRLLHKDDKPLYAHAHNHPDALSASPELELLRTVVQRFLTKLESDGRTIEDLTDAEREAWHRTILEIDRMLQTESKRIYQSELVAGLFHDWLQQAAGILEELLLANLPPEQAAGVAREFASRTAAATKVKASVGL